MKKYIYFHICCINNWKDVVNDLLFKIKDSKLYDFIDEIRCCILGKCDDMSLFNYDKIKIIDTNEDITLYETFTINKLYEDSKKEDFMVLYIHSKGLNHNGKNQCVLDWVDYLSYFNIYLHSLCIKLLEDNYDTVGVNLQFQRALHYSGNFWWSKSSYINKLEKCIYNHYNAPEFWITEKNIGKYANLWSSKVNHYDTRYEKEKYMIK
jgi:hypothetical protein